MDIKIKKYVCKYCRSSFLCDEKVDTCSDRCAIVYSKIHGTCTAPDRSQDYYKTLIKTSSFGGILNFFNFIKIKRSQNIKAYKPYKLSLYTKYRIKLRKKTLLRIFKCNYEKCNKVHITKRIKKYCNNYCAREQNKLLNRRLNTIDNYFWTDKYYEDCKEKELIKKTKLMTTTELLKEFGNLK